MHPSVNKLQNDLDSKTCWAIGSFTHRCELMYSTNFEVYGAKGSPIIGRTSCGRLAKPTNIPIYMYTVNIETFFVQG